MKNQIPKPIELAQQLIEKIISPGECVVDATLGNGHDALFLSHLVTETGFVYGYDIQEKAIVSSNERLKSAGCENFKLFLKSHALMAEDIKVPVATVMFNLGYLPSSDKSIISKTESTLEAVQSAQELLRVAGLITIMCYPGHEGGAEESAAVLEYVKQLDRKLWRVFRYEMLNVKSSPAFLVVLEKI